MGKQKDILEKLAEIFQIRHVLLRQALAECLGTLILVVSKECFCIPPAGCRADRFVQVKEDNRFNCSMFTLLSIN